MGMSRLPVILLLAAAKSAITHWTENSKSRSVLKTDILSVSDANENKNVGRREAN